MSKTEQKKLKGIVSISSEDFMAKNNQNNQNTTNNNNKQKNSSPIKPKTQTTKKKQANKSTNSSAKSFQLPDNFFERILDCEFKIKEKFDPKTFYELINLYSSAINFYESIKDPKFITYNQSLNLLFSMPEVKKFMEGSKSLTKTEKKNDIEKRMLQSEKKITKEKVNKIYLSKLQKNFGKNIINDDFNKQSDIFKKRREEKKRRYLLSTSALTTGKKQDLNEESNNNDENHNNEENIKIKKKRRIINANKSMDIVIPKNDKSDNGNDDFDSEDYDDEENEKNIIRNYAKKNNPINIMNCNGENNVLDELKKEDLKNEINKISINGNENDSANNLDDTLSFSDNLLIDLSKIQRMTNKTLFHENLKSILDTYITEFYDIFMEKTANSIIKDYTESGKIIEKKLCESAINSYNQQKEMEYLLNGDESDENYNDQLQSMIQQIKDEQSESELKILKEGEQREKILNEKYINSINNFHYHKLDMLKEKLKLEVTKSVNSIILK